MQDNGGSCGALLVYLSIGFDCIVRDLLLAKLSACGFDYNSLKLIKSFLSGRKLRTKISSSYCPYLDLLVGVPQGSILDPLLFIIYMCDLFLCDANLTSLIKWTTQPFMLVNEIWTLYRVNLKKDNSTVLTWFQNNYLKGNSEKSHLLTTSHYSEHINVGGKQVCRTIRYN